jgi:hypothetical protein
MTKTPRPSWPPVRVIWDEMKQATRLVNRGAEVSSVWWPDNCNIQHISNEWLVFEGVTAMSDVNQAVEETAKKKPASKKTVTKKPAAKKAKGKKAPKVKAKKNGTTKRVKADVEVPAKLKGKRLTRLLNSVSNLESLTPKDKTYAAWLYIARKAEKVKGGVPVEDYLRTKHPLGHLEALMEEGRVVAK